MVPVVLMYSCSPFHHLFNSTSFTFFIKFQFREVMESSKEEGKMFITNEEDEDDEDMGKNNEKKRALTQLGKGTSSARGITNCFCQVENCTSDMNEAKTYHRRHKVCEFHAKAAAVLITGTPKRFCQQCSRFHELSEFDEAKRSCRRRLAGHNERRRKISYDSQ